MEANSINTVRYYPLGSVMPGRNYISSLIYRYGFQGQFAEKDPETNMSAFELRMYDGLLGRWKTTDPYGQYHSPYLGMGNDFVNGVDPDGGFFDGLGDPIVGYTLPMVTITASSVLTSSMVSGIANIMFGEPNNSFNIRDKHNIEMLKTIYNKNGIPQENFRQDIVYQKPLPADIQMGKDIGSGIADGLAGEFAGIIAVKVFTKAANIISSANKVVRTEELVQSAQKLYPKKANLIELHHITPKYLGGAVDGPLMPLNGSYHQVITNEFRSLWPYGKVIPSPSELQQVMKQVYSKYPLPPMQY